MLVFLCASLLTGINLLSEFVATFVHFFQFLAHFEVVISAVKLHEIGNPFGTVDLHSRALNDSATDSSHQRHWARDHLHKRVGHREKEVTKAGITEFHVCGLPIVWTAI